MFRINWNDNKILDENKPKVYSQKVPDELELDDADECLELKSHGLYIICGPSNSGKSNTIKNIVK
jgi:type II secretory ATPase GspE/PulE/Tfp pilus assembly ATPase PilB-like protein